MKKTGLILIGLFALFLVSCTEDFNEINEQPNALSSSDVSAKYFVTNVQTGLFAPNRYPYWRGPIIHVDRYAGHTAFGFSANWWSDALGYDYSAGYTGAVYGWLSGYNSQLTAFTNFVKEGGELENDQYYAISLIMKGLYYQMYSDTFGMVPFSEASNPDVTTPKYDTHKNIYKGIITGLDEAISLIGSNSTTGSGPEILTDNDLFFNGDMQKWKSLANSLKLRIALRANGADGDDFSTAAAASAISAGVLGDTDALIQRDTEISTWASAVYGDVWHSFYGGGHWNLAASMVDALRDNNDPRLFKYATPSKGGTITITKPVEGENVSLIDKHIAFLKSHFDKSGATYTLTETDADVSITMPENTNYIGAPTRANDKPKPYLHTDFFSKPADIVVNKKNTGKPIFPWIVMSAADSHLMVAEAIVKGLATGDAQGHYQTGIRHAMKLWGVDEASIDTFLNNENMGSLSGSTEEQLEKIAIQRWLANFTNGFEGWAIVRDSGYPAELYAGVSDKDLYALGTTLNGAYPQRMRYGSGAYNSNGENLEAALSTQGPDVQGTKLWWAK
ncbi:MAG: SusD/RagB family nutrient-binding outer membrane lipoprotein [Flavobacteriaceae bacterium]|nr:SusD/RagB family nutrient-binding outer membrane lipoprotein [Flavobacteriaceae bacterium]